MRRARSTLAALVAALLAATPAVAAPIDEPTRAKARVIGEEGLSLYDQGQYIDALDRFERAFDILKAPTLELMAARCLTRMGRLVEASERYLDVTRMSVDDKASTVLKDAITTAAREREAVLARIATIEIVIEGPSSADSDVRIDGRPVPRAVIGVKTPINPGIHRIEARGASGTEAFGRVNVNERQSVRLVLTLHAAEKTAAPAPGPPRGGDRGPRVPVPGKVGLSLGGEADPKDDAPKQNARIDEQTRAAARTIGEEGLKLYDAGNYFDALDRFERADALIHAPTLGLMAARSLVALRRLVEASDRYEDVSQMRVEAKASDAFKDAVVASAKERAALLTRLPFVDVSVEGPGATEITELQIDGRTVAPQLLGIRKPINAKLPLDPGHHRLEVRLGSQEAYERIALNEGDTVRVVLRLGATVDQLAHTTAPDAAPRAPGASASEPEAWSVSPEAQRRRTTQLAAGFVGLGVGAIALITGGAAGGVAIGKKAALDAQCNPTLLTCPTALRDDVDAYNGLRIASTAGFIVGGVGLALGAALLVTAPRATVKRKDGTLTVTPLIGLVGAGLVGAF
jgi:tetratricopeptide (TPR) repeat protein